MKFFYAFFILMGFSLVVRSQSIYVSTSTNLLKKVTITPGGLSFVDVPVCTGFSLNSIAIYKKTLYGFNGFGLYKGDITANGIVNCKLLFNTSASTNSLTADSTGILYLAGNDKIYKLDPNSANPSIVLVGTIPYTAAGDLIFYKNELYLAATVGIVKIDLINPAKSTLHIPISGFVYGLTAAAFNSTQNKTYATVVTSTATNLIELDMDNKAVVKTIGSLPYIVYDAASDVESGIIPKIIIDSVKQFADCPYTGKGTLQVFCANPLSDYQYTLNSTTTNTTGIFNGLIPGNYNIRVTTGLISEDTTVTVLINAFDKPVITPSTVDEDCDQKGQISFTTNANSSLYNIQLGASSFPINHIFSTLTSGNYHFSLLNLSGCAIDTFTVKVNRIKCAISIDSITINKTCTDIHNGNIRIYYKTYTTALNTFLFDNSVTNTTGVFNNVAPGTYPLRITTSEGIIKDLTVIVPDYYLNKPVVSILKIDENCDQKGEISFSTTSGNSLYNIQYGGAIYPIGNVFSGLTAGGYHFSLLNKNGCLIDTFYVSLLRIKCAINITSIVINKECDDVRKGSIKVSCVSYAGVTNTYTLNQQVQNNTGLFSMLDPNLYTINILTSEGISKDTSVTIPDYYLQKPATTYNAVNQTCHIYGQAVVYVQQGNSLFNVKLGTATYPSGHVFSNLPAGSYFFSVFNSQGCLVDTLTIKLKLEECDPVVFPNTFTPNNDGINDIFKPMRNGRATQYKLSIFNRYGILMFTSTHIGIGWDGTNQGLPVPVGAYYWLLTYYNDDNKYATQSGSVLLVR